MKYLTPTTKIILIILFVILTLGGLLTLVTKGKTPKFNRL